MNEAPDDNAVEPIAIVGMACRFPGAADVDAFWRNLRAGVESIHVFSEAELQAAGVPPDVYRQPGYVAAHGKVEDADCFDAEFFGFSPREAAWMDPQHRLFLECAWSAIEHAGHDPGRTGARCGVIAGVGINTYLINNLLPHPDIASAANFYPLFTASDKDFLATRVAYKFDLTGPAFGVNTACSSSLVAVHLACQQLWSWQCDAVLAGGVSLQTPQDSGYLHQMGGITSADGHCRAFDAAAGGTVPGSGVGVVLLKRLSDAQAAGDTIHAVIRGSACNNDGAQKAGYTAPSIAGQAAVIAEAQAMAGVAPESIAYLEAHGTGTALGDPIEIAALTQAFASARRQFCRIGSVKTNIGHLDTAAGIAGLIKTVLALQRQEIPPSLHYQAANPKINFAASPFVVNDRLMPWPQGSEVRRAAVSSFGLGGTNAHMILEEAPQAYAPPASGTPRIFPLSARNPAALQRQAAQLAEHLDTNTCLDEIAWTLADGRRHFAEGAFVIAETPSELASALRAGTLQPLRRPAQAPRVAFLFPGQGAQQAGAGRLLHRDEPAFRTAFDECVAALRAAGAPDIGPLLLQEPSPANAVALQRTENAQPALFALGVALAALWRHRGIEPAAVLGHSAGEYAAAVCAGVLPLADAARALAARARLMAELPPGAMTAVGLPKTELEALLGQITETLTIAAVNGPALCTVAGSGAAIETLEARLARRGVFHRRLHTAHAFHSPAVAPVLDRIHAALENVHFSAAKIPFYSSVLGRQAGDGEIADRALWVRQIREPVLFAPAVDALLADGFQALVEAGPGSTLTALARQSPHAEPHYLLLPGLPADADERRQQLDALGQLWLAGAQPHWAGLFTTTPQRRPLPTYPFERQRHWVAPPTLTPRVPETIAATSASDAPRPIDDWFYVPGWRRAAPQLDSMPGDRWLVFTADGILPDKVLEALGNETILVRKSTDFCSAPPALNPEREADYDALLNHLASNARLPDRILFGWGLDGDDPLAAFQALLRLCRALARQQRLPTELTLLSRGFAAVHDDETGEPLHACLQSTLRVIPEELPGLRCRGIDLPAGTIDAGLLTRELLATSTDRFTALRGRHRWLPAFDPLPLPRACAPVFRQGGAYLVTGGLGGMGLLLAGHLARSAGAQLVLTSRRALPPADEWERLAAGSSRIRQQLSELQEFLTQRESALGTELAIPSVEDHPGLRTLGNGLAAALAIAYLRQQGVRPKTGQHLSDGDFAAACQVLPEFQRLLRHLLNMLVEDGWLERDAGTLRVLRDFDTAPDAAALLERIKATHPGLAPQFEMVADCAARYPEALSGRIPAISVLYPDGHRYIIADAAARSEELGNFRVYRSLLADLLRDLALRAGPGRPLRILEVGGGNAIMAALVAERLRGLNVEYHFTDLGTSFVQAAADRARERGYGFMRFATFDITRDPVAQGFDLGSFDAVVGLDVVHATPALRDTVSNLRRLLAPGGLLGLVESARTERWNDMVFGLAEGWWYAQDTELRNPHSPLLSTARWEQALAGEGFSSLLALPLDPQQRARTDCSLILAQNGAPGTARADAVDDGIDHATLRALLEIRSHAAGLLVCQADVADAEQMEAVVAQAEARFGPLHGVIHAAAVEDKALIVSRCEPFAEAELHPKLAGALTLDKVFRDRPLDFMLLCSSITGTIGGAGQVGYCAANAFLDAFAEQRSRQRPEPTVAIAWGRWQGVGLARLFESWHASRTGATLEGGMSAEQGIDALERILHHRVAPRVAVMNTEWRGDPAAPTMDQPPALAATATPPTPETPTTFAGSPLERQLADIWQQLLGTPRFDRHTRFQELGGDSLVGIQLIGRIKEQLGVQLPIRSIFDHPTIAAQAECIAATTSAIEEGEL